MIAVSSLFNGATDEAHAPRYISTSGAQLEVIFASIPALQTTHFPRNSRVSIREKVIATTCVDNHGERLTKAALESMVEQSRAAIIPVLSEHDPRNPPIGRTLDALIRKRSDGEYELVVTFEQFDHYASIGNYDSPIDEHDHRDTLVRSYPEDAIQVVWDRSYREPTDQRMLGQLASLGAPRMHLVEAHKKAIEPVSFLILGGAYVLGKIVEGILSKIGSDVWEGFKSTLSKILKRKRIDTGEAVLQLDLTLSAENARYSVSVFATNPKETDIDMLFDRNIHHIDPLVAKILATDVDVRVVVLEQQNERLSIKYVIRQDGIPMIPRTGDSDEHGS